jgi:hypothetical protein
VPVLASDKDSGNQNDATIYPTFSNYSTNYTYALSRARIKSGILRKVCQVAGLPTSTNERLAFTSEIAMNERK